MRGIAAGAAVILTAGLGTVAVGILRSDPAKAAGGACLTVTAITLVALCIIRRWLTDTADERGRLADATAAANEERTRYVACLAAVEAERARVRRDAGIEATRQRAQLDAERDSMRDEFEAQRHELVIDTFQTAVLMERAGLLIEPPTASVTHLFPHRGRPTAIDASVRHPS